MIKKLKGNKMRKEIAYKAFMDGNNCAQSVLLPFIEKANISQETAISISQGFGGGMGKMQEKCGALTGVFMAIGLIVNTKYSDKIQRKKMSEIMIKEFNNRFFDEFGNTTCRELLDCDINTEMGQKQYSENDYRETKCAKYVMKAVEMLESMG